MKVHLLASSSPIPTLFLISHGRRREGGKVADSLRKRERKRTLVEGEKKWVVVMPMVYFIRIHATGAFALVASQRGGGRREGDYF